MVTTEKEENSLEFKILNYLSEHPLVISPKKAYEDLNEYRNRIRNDYLLKKGFTIEYDNTKIFEEDFNEPKLTKFKENNNKFESIIYHDTEDDLEKKRIGKILMNGNKLIENYFKDLNDVDKIPLEFERKTRKQTNYSNPKFLLNISIMEEINNHILDLNSGIKLVPSISYFKINDDYLELDKNLKHDVYIKNSMDPNGDVWYLFLAKSKDSVKENFLKGFKKYKIIE